MLLFRWLNFLKHILQAQFVMHRPARFVSRNKSPQTLALNWTKGIHASWMHRRSPMTRLPGAGLPPAENWPTGRYLQKFCCLKFAFYPLLWAPFRLSALRIAIFCYFWKLSNSLCEHGLQSGKEVLQHCLLVCYGFREKDKFNFFVPFSSCSGWPWCIIQWKACWWPI